MTRHIAVFDPSPDLLLLFRWLLGAKGYVVTFHDPNPEGLARVQSLKLDLLLLNLATADDGALVTQLRVLPALRLTPIVLLTPALPHVDLVPRSPADPIIVCLTKPFTPAALLDAVEHALHPRVYPQEDPPFVTAS